VSVENGSKEQKLFTKFFFNIKYKYFTNFWNIFRNLTNFSIKFL
jgi:hypothetical protein